MFPWLDTFLSPLASWAGSLRLQAGNTLHWGRSHYVEPVETLHACFVDAPDAARLIAREAQLLATYDLKAFQAATSRLRYSETLTILDFLDTLLTPNPPTQTALNWLDVGAKNWSYVAALYAMAQRCGQPFSLTGIELDGYRLYANLYSRQAYAQAYIRQLPHARYILGDVMEHSGQYQVITVILPFVFPEPCLKWGLPKRYFQPQAMLAHLIRLLARAGRLVIINQGAAEDAAQTDYLAPWLENKTLMLCTHQELPSSFLHYQYPRFGWVLAKT